jgi:hypothetical protein
MQRQEVVVVAVRVDQMAQMSFHRSLVFQLDMAQVAVVV